MSFFKSLPLALLAATPLAAGEYCVLDGTEVFACTFNGGEKAVEVCDAEWMGDFMASYGFFKVGGDVEKEIETDMASLTYTEWSGMGPMSEAVAFHTDTGHSYEVWWSFEDGAEYGGINVLEGGNVLATLDCDDGSVSQSMTTFIEKIVTSQVSP